jgi:hypothetical protein
MVLARGLGVEGGAKLNLRFVDSLGSSEDSYCQKNELLVHHSMYIVGFRVLQIIIIAIIIIIIVFVVASLAPSSLLAGRCKNRI